MHDRDIAKREFLARATADLTDNARASLTECAASINLSWKNVALRV